MSDVKSFNCPNCGSALMPNGNAKQIKCGFCGSTVIVPEDLRDPDQEAHEELSAEDDLFSPRHVQWLIENGLDVTVKVDIVKDTGMTKDNNPVTIIHFSGKKTDGRKFETAATINLSRNEVPRCGTTLKVKYKKQRDYIDDTSDFAVQINGKFYNSVLDDPEFLL